MKLLFAFLIQFIAFAAIGQTVMINEILSSNDKVIRDPIGDFDDYVELYNPTNAAVNIGKYFITDDKDSLFKCMIPTGTMISANGYLLVWIDGEMDQEGIHCNFKLNSKGERIILSNASMDKLDEINLKRQYDDIAFGRIPNGGSEWNYMNPTPNKANVKSKVLGKDRSKKGEKMSLAIDPSKDKFNVSIDDGGKLAYRVMDKEDKIFLKGNIDGKGEINITSLPNGKYNLVIGKNEYRIIKMH
ncbi:MAG: lamin tail domain-containing protein [Flavobacteriales bacterium]|nr:lamin tail domain-containing protein [Flavobacteriales bacterium]